MIRSSTTMETSVIIPNEFSLMLRPRDSYLHLVNGLKSIKSRQNPAEKKTETEAGVCVYSNQLIRKGTCFLPFQGTIRQDTLEVYSLLNEDDVSRWLFLFLILSNSGKFCQVWGNCFFYYTTCFYLNSILGLFKSNLVWFVLNACVWALSFVCQYLWTYKCIANFGQQQQQPKKNGLKLCNVKWQKKICQGPHWLHKNFTWPPRTEI